MSIIAEWLKKIYGSTEARLLMVGLDASGRTTMLYRWKLGEIVTTIPTIGFNVESVPFDNVSFTIWDVGGCDKIRPLWRHYYQNTSGIIFTIDSNDRERLNEVEWSIGMMLSEDELRDAPMVLVANKQDLPNAMKPEEIAEKLNLPRLMGKRNWVLLPASAVTGDGIFDVLKWLANEVKGLPQRPRVESSAPPTEESILEKWLRVEDEPDDEFLDKLAKCELETWDHRTHLRIGWLFLTKYGRKEGMKRTFEAIKHFIANSTRTHRSQGTTFHETMTYFWVHMIHYAIEATKNPTQDFKGFLVLNPQLSNGGFFLDFYKKETMLNNPLARTQVVLPDIKPLPSIIGGLPSTSSKPAQEINESLKEIKLDSDETFLADFENQKLKGWGHTQFLRVIFLYLRTKGRQQGAKEVFKRMEEFMKSGYHLSITYFWIQLVDYSVAKVNLAPEADFQALLSGCPDLKNEKLYLDYYKQETIFSPAAEKGMVLPDKKKLPAIIPGGK